MSGTRAGGLKAAQTNKERYGKSFYEKIDLLVAKKVTLAGLLQIQNLLAKQVGRAGKSRKGKRQQAKEVVMKLKTPKRLGMKRNTGHPIFLTYNIIESGKQIKAFHFHRSKTPQLHI